MSLSDNDTEGTLFGTHEELLEKIKKYPRATHEAAAQLRAKIEREEAAEKRAASRKAAQDSGAKAS